MMTFCPKCQANVLCKAEVAPSGVDGEKVTWRCTKCNTALQTEYREKKKPPPSEAS